MKTKVQISPEVVYMFTQLKINVLGDKRNSGRRIGLETRKIRKYLRDSTYNWVFTTHTLKVLLGFQ